MSFESNKNIKSDIFYCGKTLKSFSRKIIVFKSETVEKSGKKSRRLNSGLLGMTFF